MKYTLLELVQTIASSMDSDEINSINDSAESFQIANVVRTVYFDLVSRAKLPENSSLINLDASTDVSKPTLMFVPNNVSKIQWIKYNKLLSASDPITMEDVRYLPLETFLNQMYMLNTTDTNVGSFEHVKDGSMFTLLYTNDKQPDYYTTFDDFTILFDSIDLRFDTTLQRSKTLCYGQLITTFDMIDSFTPDMDEAQFALLLNEAKSLAWAELKQTQHGIAERNIRRGWTSAQKDKTAILGSSDFDQLSYFGRR